MPAKMNGNVKSDEVTECTRTSVNMVKLVDQSFRLYFTNTAIMLTGIHYQRKSNLCHSFAAISTLRQTVHHLLTKRLNRVPAEECTTILEDVTTFRKMLTIFFSCVSPRSADGLIPGQNFKCKKIRKQTAILQTVIDRLCNGTMFEIEGWKRILPIRELFLGYGVSIDDWTLSSKKVNFQANDEADRLGTKTGLSIMDKKFRIKKINFIVFFFEF